MPRGQRRAQSAKTVQSFPKVPAARVFLSKDDSRNSRKCLQPGNRRRTKVRNPSRNSPVRSPNRIALTREAPTERCAPRRSGAHADAAIHSEDDSHNSRKCLAATRAAVREKPCNPSRKSPRSRCFSLKPIPVIPENACSLANSVAHESAQSFPKLPSNKPDRAYARSTGAAVRSKASGAHADAAFTLKMIPIIPENACAARHGPAVCEKPRNPSRKSPQLGVSL